MKESSDIRKELFAPHGGNQNEEFLFEQYKMIIEDAQKSGERFEASNNLFMTSNSFIFTVAGGCFAAPYQSQTFYLIGFLFFVGLTTSITWIRVTEGYKRVSAVNYSLIRAFEEKLPSRPFSYKYIEEANAIKQRRVNIIITLEALLPKLFVFMYAAGLIVAILKHFKIL